MNNIITKRSLFTTALLLASFWGVFFLQLSFEWSNNDQYGYGSFVPFIGLYLIYLRWMDKPKSSATSTSAIFYWSIIFLAIIAIYPLKVIFETNVDWRLVIWLQAALTFFVTLLMLNQVGGYSWIKHFFFPFCFFLLAVPWPNYFEVLIITKLLNIVTYATVDILNISGIIAIQKGNLVKLSSGWVSMEEACSGVRSFQSSIMLGFFLGELFRLRILQRILLLAAGGAVAVFFNIVRTSILSFLVSAHGNAFMDEWHDFAGNAVFISCLATLSLMGFLIKRNNNKHGFDGINKVVDKSLHPISIQSSKINILSVLLILFSIPFAYYWYRSAPDPLHQGVKWSVDWNAIDAEVKFPPISYIIQDTLLYDEGVFARWKEDNGAQWLAYYFFWDRLKAAQLGGFHGPELCLPTAGWGAPESGEKIIWSKDGIDLVFNTFKFSNGYQDVYVFFAQWDTSNYPYHEKQGRIRWERLINAWNRERREDKTNLEVVIWGVESFDQAKEAFRNFLKKAIIVEKESVSSS